nr:MAG TPA: hypothetical protein [Caudoviricetes sp.]
MKSRCAPRNAGRSRMSLRLMCRRGCWTSGRWWLTGWVMSSTWPSRVSLSGSFPTAMMRLLLSGRA